MKRRFFLSVTLFALVVMGSSFVITPGGDNKAFTTLIVNAKIKLVLVSNDQSKMEIVSGKNMAKALSFSQKGDTLIIEGPRNKDFVNQGVVYISANQLRKIHINNDVHVSSLSVLRIPSLDVFINGLCEFNIHNIGMLNVEGSYKYVVEQNRMEMRVPASVLDMGRN